MFDSKCKNCGLVISLGLVLGIQTCKDCLATLPPDLSSEIRPIHSQGQSRLYVIEVSGLTGSSVVSAGAIIDKTG